MRNTVNFLLILWMAFVAFFGCKPQNFSRGGELYRLHCANCHGVQGEGLKKLYPPIAKSDYLHSHFDQLACIIRNGLQDSIVVNGILYTTPMQVEYELDETQITNLTNYIISTWYPEKPLVSLTEVKNTLQACKKQ